MKRSTCNNLRGSRQMKRNTWRVDQKKKKIYFWPQTSMWQWYLKFDETMTLLGFVENVVDQCIYLKISGSKLFSLFFMLMIFYLPVMT